MFVRAFIKQFVRDKECDFSNKYMILTMIAPFYIEGDISQIPALQMLIKKLYIKK